MMELTIHTINAATWTKYEKWRVELAIADQPLRVCWLTAVQYDYLRSAFDRTPNGYSCKSMAVIGVFDDDKGYYQRCYAMRPEPKPDRERQTMVVEAVAVDRTLLDEI